MCILFSHALAGEVHHELGDDAGQYDLEADEDEEDASEQDGSILEKYAEEQSLDRQPNGDDSADDERGDPDPREKVKRLLCEAIDEIGGQDVSEYGQTILDAIVRLAVDAILMHDDDFGRFECELLDDHRQESEVISIENDVLQAFSTEHFESTVYVMIFGAEHPA